MSMGDHCTVDANGGTATMNLTNGDAVALYDENETEKAFYKIQGVTNTGIVRVKDVNTEESVPLGKAEFEQRVDDAAIVTVVKQRD